MQKTKDTIRLALSVGPGSPLPRRIWQAGLTPEQAWDPDKMKQHGLPILKEPDNRQVEDILQAVQRNGMMVISLWDCPYPPLLREIHAPPAVLYAKGTVPDWNKHPAVAMVGTRHCSQEGIHTADMLAQALAAGGAIVVSGGAVGIDRAAHMGALQAQGITVDVMPCGLNVCYPAATRLMRQDIVDNNGVLLSEYPPNAGVNRGSFSLRNRLIAGMCAATCVVEAPQRSGSLITARWARDQGRDLYVVAGPLTDERYAGSHALLQEGAELLLEAAQVLAGIQGRFLGSVDIDKARSVQAQARQNLQQPPPPPLPCEPPEETKPKKVACPPQASDAAKQMYHFLLNGPLSLRDLAERAGCPVGIALSQLTELELLGCVTAMPGPAYAIKEAGRNR